MYTTVRMDGSTVQTEGMVNAKKHNAALRDLRPFGEAFIFFLKRGSMLSGMTTSSTGHFALTTSVVLTCSFPFTSLHRVALSDLPNVLFLFYIRRPGIQLY